MFGMRKVGGLSRRDYDGRIDKLLKEQMLIEIDDTKNPMFPGHLKYAELKDRGWHCKLSAEFNALAIAISYIGGASQSSNDGIKEAKRIFPSITSTLAEAKDQGLIALNDAEKFRPALEQIRKRLE